MNKIIKALKSVFSGDAKQPKPAEAPPPLIEITYEQLREKSLAQVTEISRSMLSMIALGNSVSTNSAIAISRRLIEIVYWDATTDEASRATAFKMENALKTDIEKAYASQNNPEGLRSWRAAREMQIEHGKRMGIFSTAYKMKSLPSEQIPDYVTSLPVDQFQSLVDLLMTNSTEAGRAAAGAIREHFAAVLAHKTKTDPTGEAARQYYRENAMKMAYVFTADEMQSLSK